VLLWVWVERRSVGKLTGFLRKGSSKNCIIVKMICFSFTLQTFSENGKEIFLFFLIMRNSSVPNFCKYFSLGNFCIKYDCPADVFPISHQWKDISVYHPYVQYILIHATYKMPCSGSWLKYQHLQSDACNSDGSFVCKYCSNCVLFFVPARLLSRPSF